MLHTTTDKGSNKILPKVLSDVVGYKCHRKIFKTTHSKNIYVGTINVLEIFYSSWKYYFKPHRLFHPHNNFNSSIKNNPSIEYIK